MTIDHNSFSAASYEAQLYKADKGKLDWTILPWEPLIEVVKVMEFAITPEKGYKRGSWALVPNGRFRYLKAAMRHLIALVAGEKLDKESGLHHAAHLVCCCLFIIYYDGLLNEE